MRDIEALCILPTVPYGNLTQDETSSRLGVSQMQVSRLLRRTLDYLLPPPPGSASASPGA